MKSMKTFAKYVLLIIAIYVLTAVLIFIGFNINYSDITIQNSLPNQVSIEKAEATKTDARIYGYIANTAENNVNGKYLKLTVYDEENNILSIEYLKIEGIGINDQKLFRANFTADGVDSYSIEIVDSEND